MGVLPKKGDVKSLLQKDSRVTCISLIQPILAYFYPCINKKDTETIASANLEDAKWCKRIGAMHSNPIYPLELIATAITIIMLLCCVWHLK